MTAVVFLEEAEDEFLEAIRYYTEHCTIPPNVVWNSPFLTQGGIEPILSLLVILPVIS